MTDLLSRNTDLIVPWYKVSLIIVIKLNTAQFIFLIKERGIKNTQFNPTFSVKLYYACVRVLISVGGCEDLVVMNFKSVR